MFRFTLVGRVVRKLVYIGHTVLVIEADRANASLVCCVVRDQGLKQGVDDEIRTCGSVRVDGQIEWFHAISPNAACCYFHFVAESVVHVDDGARQ
jgi:hypothetical protein